MFRKLFRKEENQRGGPAGSRMGGIAAAPTFADTKAPIIAVLGAKGGVGASSVAVNLAMAMSITGVETTIVDANFQQPDVAQLSGVEPEHSLMELIEHMPDLDQQLYSACCSPLNNFQPCLSLLSPSLDGETNLKANLSQLAGCLELIRPYSGLWIIDLPKHLDKHLITVTDLCDKILLVFESSLSSVAACRRWLNIFGDLGYDKSQIVCVLNRAGSKYAEVEKQLSSCFSDQPILHIPNASGAAWECSTRGVPIVAAHPKHIYTQAMFKLAQHISESNGAMQAGGIAAAPTETIDSSEVEKHGLINQVSTKTLVGSVNSK